MRIYTKTGDKGETSLFGGKRVPKSEPRLNAYGTLDELNSQVGVVRALMAKDARHQSTEQILQNVQNYLFTLGSHLALGDPKKIASLPPLDTKRSTTLEEEIDRMEEALEPLKNFILPGGSLTSAHLHLARGICRRAERFIVDLESVDPGILVYINRLSDYLFVAARYANHVEGVPDHPWEK